MESLKRFFRKLVKFFYLPPVLVILFNIGACSSIIYDNNDLGIMLILLSMAMLALQLVVFVAALLQRRWLIGVITLLLFLATTAITFLSVVGIAVGQHHPPRYDDEEVVDSLALDSIEMAMLEKDSLAVDSIDATLPDNTK